MLEAEKSKHSAQDQETINSFTKYARNEIKKDFCFIDREGIVKQIDSLERLKIIGPNGTATRQK